MIVHTNQKPPCWDRLVKAFGVQWVPGVFVTYGGEIYSFDPEIPHEFLVHEAVHVEQQKGMSADEYVDRYIADQAFRMQVELPAYRVHNEFLRATIANPDELFVKIHRNQKSLSKITGRSMEEIRTILI